MSDYSLLQTEAFWTFVGCMLALVSSVVGFTQWRKDSAQKLKEEAAQTLTKIVENDLRMKDSYRASWSTIASFKGDAKKEIFLKEIGDIRKDEVRASVFQVIDILSDVHYYYKMFQIPIESTQWIKHFRHTFDPVKMKAFVTAFEKYESENQFSDAFVKFVREIINQNQSSKHVQEEKSFKGAA